MRGQKWKKEEERFVGEGSSKNKNLDYINLLSNSDMEVDGELSDSEDFVHSERKNDGKETEGQKEGGKEDGK